MPYYFAHADVLLVTLLSKKIFSYTIPGKIQSYLACGKPILAALNGEGAKVILESKSGIVVDAEDSQELSRAAIKMKNMSSSELDELGINGLNFYSKNFERNLIIDKIDLLLKEQINK
jgi:glycosyltransferase involved in cell wall biosynthesis